MAVYRTVEYYGILEEDSNFEVLFEDEYNDYVWASRDPEVYQTWEDVIDYLIDNNDEPPLEVSAI